MGLFSYFAPWSQSDAVDASELLAPVEQDGYDFQEAAPEERVPTPEKCRSLKRFCFCALILVGVLAAAFSAIWRIFLYIPPFPVMEGRLPTKPFFIKHLGGFCFGRHRVEEDPYVGRIDIEVFKDSTTPWGGDGEMYLLLFDDEPGHWKAAASEWNVSAWSHLIAYSNGCREMLYLKEVNGTQPVLHITRRVSMNIRENYQRQWNAVLVGVNLHLHAGLVGNLRYRISGNKARLQWERDDLLRDSPPTCPPDLAEWSKEVWHDYVLSPRQRPVPLEPMSWIMDPESKPVKTTPPPRRDPRHDCHGILAR